jgi:oxygen-dependent protoporphyrinogen oxidase
VSTSRVGPYVFEDGPNSVQGKGASFLSHCEELGLSGDVLHAADDARDRFLYYHGGLHPLPRNGREFVRTPLFTPAQKLRVLLEPFVRSAHPETEETVAEFFGRRIGRGITMTWIDVVVSGTYGGNPNHLGIQSAFPELGRMERERGSIFRAMRVRARERRRADGTTAAAPLLGLRGGLGRLMERMARALEGRVHLEASVKEIRRSPDGGAMLAVAGPGGQVESAAFDRVVVAVPARAAAVLVASGAPEAADLLCEVECASIVVIHAGFEAASVPGLPRGFGFLVPRCMRARTLGWIFASHLFPERAPEGRVALNGYLGGILDPRAIDLKDGMIRALMLGELALMLGQRKIPRPEVFSIRRWHAALPQYAVGHARRIAAVRALVQRDFPEMRVAGNWTDGISLDATLGSGRRAADEILAGRETVAP